MNLNFIICVCGLGVTGSTVLKEFSRFLSTFKSELIQTKLIAIDKNVVTENDMGNGSYFPDEIEFSKAASLACSIYDTLNVPIVAFDKEIKKSDQLRKIIESQYEKSYSNKKVRNIVILIDTTNRRVVAGAAEKAYSQFSDALYIRANKNQIVTSVRANGLDVSTKVPVELRESHSFADSYMVSYLILTEIVRIYSDRKFMSQPILYDTNTYFSGTSEPIQIQKNLISLDKKKEQVVILIGCGGTGGNFAKEFGRFLLTHPNTKLILIDGDRVEEKNKSRQPFANNNIMKYKSKVVYDELLKLGILEEQLSVYNGYIDTVEDLSAIIEREASNDANLYLVGGVDNHRARQVLHAYFESADSLIWIDSANGFSRGECVIGVKRSGEKLSPSRVDCFPEVLEDTSPSASEMSCGQLNETSPQHLVTNLTAAGIMNKVLENSIDSGFIEGGIVYFNTFQYFKRMQPLAKGGF